MLLSDGEMRDALRSGDLGVVPLAEENIQPASIDLRLLDEVIDDDGPRRLKPEGEWLVPSDFLLASTVERITLGDAFAGRIEGKSSLGRRGLLVHCTAGFVDPGFGGRITLELANVGRKPVLLVPGMLICQLTVLRLGRAAEYPYGHPRLRSHYQGQTTTTEAR